MRTALSMQKCVGLWGTCEYAFRVRRLHRKYRELHHKVAAPQGGQALPRQTAAHAVSKQTAYLLNLIDLPKRTKEKGKEM